MESPLYDQIGRFLISQKLKGSLKSGESLQEYIIKGYSLFGDAEDIILEVETPDKRPHRISLNQHLSDLVISQPLAQSSPKLTRREKKVLEQKEFDRGFDDASKEISSRPTSLDYVRGYEKGREVLAINKRIRH